LGAEAVVFFIWLHCYTMGAAQMQGTRELSMLQFEKACWAEGYQWVVGVDEAGRGPLAGPVIAACVLLPRRSTKRLDGLTDSKQLTEAQREHYYALLQDLAVAIGVGEASAAEIDEINILQATFLAMRRALASIPRAEVALVDGNRPIKGLELPQRTIVKGDSLSRSIAAASVIAKVTRDRFMVQLHEAHPEYGFARHKGYGTKVHYEALAAHGPTAQHRRSFLRKSPVV
jgi:ribonuclease HII